MAQLGLHVIQSATAGDDQGGYRMAAGMNTDRTLYLGLFQHAVEWLGDVVEWLTRLLTREQIGVTRYHWRLLQYLHRHVVEMQDPALAILGVRDEQGLLNPVQVLPLG